MRIRGLFSSEMTRFGCRFGKAYSSSVIVMSATEIQCLSPAYFTDSEASSVTVPLLLTVDARDAFPTSFVFLYYRDPILASISPSIGPLDGSRIAHIYGKFFLGSLAPTCVFGDTMVPATVRTDFLVVCQPPSVTNAKDVFVSFSGNGVDFSSSVLVYSYTTNPSILSLSPSSGTLTGGTVVYVTAINLFRSVSWFCAFGEISSRATYISRTEISCESPSAPHSIFTPGEVSFQLLNLPSVSSDLSLLSPNGHLSSSFVAEGVLTFRYTAPLILHSVFPNVLFESGGSKVTIDGSNIELSDGLECVWGNGEYISSTSLGDFGSGVSCLSPLFSDTGFFNLTLQINGKVETDSYLSIFVVSQPVLRSISPSRVVHGRDATIVIESTSLFIGATSPSCHFFAGSEVIAQSDAIISDSEVMCSLPPVVSMGREVQRVSLSGPSPTNEIQAIEVTSAPNQYEVQRIQTSGWGEQLALMDIRLANVVPLGDQGVALLATQTSFTSAVKMLTLQPAPFVSELQAINVLAYAIPSVMIDGIMILSLGGVNITMGWNATAVELVEQILLSTSISHVNATKTTAVSPQSASLSGINITWVLEFGPSDGNVPLVRVEEITVVDAVVVSTSTATLINGISCEVQAIEITGVNSGEFSLSYLQKISYPISIPSTPSAVRSLILVSFPEINDVLVEIDVLSDTGLRYLVYFIGNAGPQVLLMPSNVSLTNTIFSSPNINASVKLESFVLVNSTVLPLSGSFQMSNFYTGQSVLLNVSTDPSLVPTVVPFLANVSAAAANNPYSLSWILTFGLNYGYIGPLIVNTSAITSVFPVVNIKDLFDGTGPDVQLLTASCTSGTALGAQFYLRLDDRLMGDISSTISPSDFIALFSTWTDIFLSNVSIYNTSSQFTINITVSDAIVPRIGYFGMGGLYCSDGQQASITTTRLQEGRFIHTSGSFFLNTSYDDAELPSDASAAEVSSALLQLGLGETLVVRTSTGMGTAQWIITFLEATSDLVLPSINSSGLVSAGRVSATWIVVDPPTQSCCMPLVSFVLYNSCLNLSSNTLLSTSTASEVLSAFQTVSGVSNGTLSVEPLSRPAGGISFYVQFASSLSMSCLSVENTSPPALNFSNQSASQLLLASLVPYLNPQTQTIFLHASSPLSGKIDLILPPFSCLNISIDISSEDLSTELRTCFSLDSVSVQRSYLDWVVGDYRRWDVTFTSIAGAAPLLVCNSLNTTSLDTGDVTCTVTVSKNATSSALGGFFDVFIPGYTWVQIPYNASAASFKVSLENLLELDVNVSRAALEYDGGFQWDVTFLADRGTEGEILVDGSGLQGTSAVASSTALQIGSYMYGNYTLTLDGRSSAPIQFNASAASVEDAINALFLERSVAVSSQSTAQGYLYLVTFASRTEDIPHFVVDGSSLTGNQARAYSYEVVKGIGSLQGNFSLGYLGQMTSSLDQDVSAFGLETALKALATIGDVEVERVVDPNGGSSWLVTFLTTGSPSNAGDLPLLVIDGIQSSIIGFNVTVEEVTPGCCDIRISYSSHGDVSATSIPIIVDMSPTVTSILPLNGVINGGTNVTLQGSGFSATTNYSLCLFGSVSSPSVVTSESTAYCISPPHPEGLVIVSLVLDPVGSNILQSFAARSSQVFVYEKPLTILYLVPDHIQIGAVVDISVVFSPSLSHEVRENITCSWSIEINSSFSSVFSLQLSTDCLLYNTSTCICASPDPNAFFAPSQNIYIPWALSTTASGTLQISKNLQQFSPPFAVSFFAEPTLYSISPEYGFFNSPSLITFAGDNFVKTLEAACSAGGMRFPAMVSSSSELTCFINGLQITSSVYRLRLLYPLIRHEVQEVEFVYGAYLFQQILMANFSLSLDGFITSQIEVGAPASVLATCLSVLPYAGNVAVSLKNYSRSDFYTGNVESILQYSITFISREDDVSTLSVIVSDDLSSIVTSGDNVLVKTIMNGGSDSLIPEVQQWGFSVNNTQSSVQLIEIFALSPQFETQTLTINSTSLITGFFSVSFEGAYSALISCDASSEVFLAAMRSIPSIGNIRTSRSNFYAYGNTWTITFLDYDGPRPLLVAHNYSLFSPAAINIYLAVLTTEAAPLGGTFSFESGMNSTYPFGIDASSTDLELGISAQLGFQNTSVSAVVANASSISYLVTFSSVYGAVPLLQVNSSELIGSGLQVASTNIAVGTSIMEGSYSLVIANVSTHLYLNDSVDIIQMALEDSLAIAFSGLIPLVKVVQKDVFSRFWAITFPLTLGNLSQLSINMLHLSNPNTTVDVLTLQEGTFESLEGNFSLIINNQSISSVSDLSFNISAPELELALATVLGTSSPTVSRVDGIQLIDRSLYNTFEWFVSLSRIQNASFLAAPTLDINSSSLIGQHSFAMLLEETGEGPDFEVELTFDGQTFTQSKLQYHAVPPFVLLDMFPRQGLVTGGSRLLLTIDPIYDSFFTSQQYAIQCLFNDSRVPARVTTFTTVECITPPYPNLSGGNATVALTLNGQDRALGSFLFTYISNQVSLNLAPTSGVVTGGTLVNISSSSITQSRYARCSFNGIVVRAVESSDGYLMCLTPAVSIPGIASVTYSLNGQDFVIGTNLLFTYVPAMVVTRIDPAYGSVGGGTSVTVSGQHFDPLSSTATCKFGDVVVSATVSTSNSLSCSSPPVKSKYEVQEIEVALLPFIPAVQVISAATLPLTGDSVAIQISADHVVPYNQSIQFLVSDVNEVKQLTVGALTNAPLVARLQVTDVGAQSEIQVLRTSVNALQEIQAIIIR